MDKKGFETISVPVAYAVIVIIIVLAIGYFILPIIDTHCVCDKGMITGHKRVNDNTFCERVEKEFNTSNCRECHGMDLDCQFKE